MLANERKRKGVLNETMRKRTLSDVCVNMVSKQYRRLIGFSYFSVLGQANVRILDIRLSAGSHFRPISSYYFPIGHSTVELSLISSRYLRLRINVSSRWFAAATEYRENLSSPATIRGAARKMEKAKSRKSRRLFLCLHLYLYYWHPPTTALRRVTIFNNVAKSRANGSRESNELWDCEEQEIEKKREREGEGRERKQ